MLLKTVSDASLDDELNLVLHLLHNNTSLHMITSSRKKERHKPCDVQYGLMLHVII